MYEYRQRPDAHVGRSASRVRTGWGRASRLAAARVGRPAQPVPEDAEIAAAIGRPRPPMSAQSSIAAFRPPRSSNGLAQVRAWSFTPPNASTALLALFQRAPTHRRYRARAPAGGDRVCRLRRQMRHRSISAPVRNSSIRATGELRRTWPS